MTLEYNTSSRYLWIWLSQKGTWKRGIC